MDDAELVRRLKDIYLSEENGPLCHLAAKRIAATIRALKGKSQ